MLREQLDVPDMVVLVLPSLIAVVQHADANEYKKIVQPELHRILTMARPVQVKSQPPPSCCAATEPNLPCYPF